MSSIMQVMKMHNLRQSFYWNASYLHSLYKMPSMRLIFNFQITLIIDRSFFPLFKTVFSDFIKAEVCFVGPICDKRFFLILVTDWKQNISKIINCSFLLTELILMNNFYFDCQHFLKKNVLQTFLKWHK